MGFSERNDCPGSVPDTWSRWTGRPLKGERQKRGEGQARAARRDERPVAETEVVWRVEAGEGLPGVRCCRKLSGEQSPSSEGDTKVETRLRRRGREGGRDEEGLHLTRGWPIVGWKQAAPAAYPKSCVSGNQSLSVVKLC